MVLRTASFHSRFFSVLIPPAPFRVFCLFLTWGGGGTWIASPPEMNTFWLNAGFLDLPFVLTALTVLFPLAGLLLPGSPQAGPSLWTAEAAPAGSGRAHSLAPPFVPCDTRFCSQALSGSRSTLPVRVVSSPFLTSWLLPEMGAQPGGGPRLQSCLRQGATWLCRGSAVGAGSGSSSRRPLVSNRTRGSI